MARLDSRAARLLALVLALTALIGFGQGLAQALRAPRPEQVSANLDPLRDPVPNAAALTAPAMDEARVRQIARDEANAVLGATRRKAAAPAPKPDPDDADDDAPAKPAPAIEPPPTTPALTVTKPPPVLTRPSAAGASTTPKAAAGTAPG